MGLTLFLVIWSFLPMWTLPPLQILCPVVFLFPYTTSPLSLTSASHGQSFQRTWNTTPAFPCGVLLFLGCSNILWKIKWGFIAIITPWQRNTWLRDSKTPSMVSVVSVSCHYPLSSSWPQAPLTSTMLHQAAVSWYQWAALIMILDGYEWKLISRQNIRFLSAKNKLSRWFLLETHMNLFRKAYLLYLLWNSMKPETENVFDLA